MVLINDNGKVPCGQEVDLLMRLDVVVLDFSHACLRSFYFSRFFIYIETNMIT